jgi:hypothetical protein
MRPPVDAGRLLRELVDLKDRLAINVELASPPDFIPELPGWRERSPLVFRDGNVDVHHSTRTRRPCRRSSAALRTTSLTSTQCWTAA